jgi:hypothetical protein
LARRNRTVWWALAAGSVIAVVGCGSSAREASPARTTTVPSRNAAAVDYRASFLAAIEGYDAATTRLQRSTNLTAGQLSSFAAAISSVESRLMAVTWPGQAEADVVSLVRDLQDLAEAAKTQALAAFNHDDAQAAAALTVVRSDLGLPRT